VLRELKPYQRVSQWPGIHIIAHKNKLGTNLMYLRSQFEEAYDFFPVTYMLPYDMNAFKREFIKKKTPEKEPTPETAPIEVKATVVQNEKIEIEQSRSELMTTITSTAEPVITNSSTAAIQPITTSDLLATKAAAEPKKKTYKTEREKSKPIFEKKE
jgi:hypothetical protein|tara:strand:+ start:665 stop:1135 length:471 start_codon:yes stop_codon:yes gene_type:complete